MNKVRSIVLSVIMVIGLLGNAGASSVLESEIYAADIWMSYAGWSSANDFTLALNGFNPVEGYAITSAILSLTFTDDGGAFDLEEFAALSYDGGTTYFEVDSGKTVIPISPDGLNALNSEGELAFTLQRYFGDFSFTGAKLTAECTPVPIPGSIWLLGPTFLAFLVMKKRFTQAYAW